jgi:hypothetical protein
MSETRRRFLPDCDLTVTHRHKNGLDGKVSCVAIEAP